MTSINTTRYIIKYIFIIYLFGVINIIIFHYQVDNSRQFDLELS
jgi:hypothetical protein